MRRSLATSENRENGRRELWQRVHSSDSLHIFRNRSFDPTMMKGPSELSGTDPAAETHASLATQDAAAAPDGELLQSTAVWRYTKSSQEDTLEPQSKPPFDSDRESSSPPSSQSSSVVDLSSPARSVDSDFEIVAASQDIPEADGTNEANPTARASRILPSILSSRGKQSNKVKEAATIAHRGHQTALLGTSNMDAGSSHDYGDTDWQQAGHDATDQDLAGPGSHGLLECTVDKPQKEGEGTQNPYISYLVTTHVRPSHGHSTSL